MRRSRHTVSLFSQSADRGVSAAYFLGAVVPLVTLGALIHWNAGSPYPAIPDAFEALGGSAAVGLFGWIAALTLSCYFLLRALVQRCLAENRALSYYDPLTGLPNRRMYLDRVDQALLFARRRGGLAAICLLDLDGFKRVNDTFGHTTGDQLLRQVAERLVDSVRLSDAVARSSSRDPQASISRFGGDEFIILLNGISEGRDAGLVANRILHALRSPFVVGQQEVFVTASIGIAVYPYDGEDSETLIRNGDAAMYAAKDDGRNGYQFYSSSMNEAIRRKLELEGRLARVLDRDELSLVYQPIRGAVDGEIRAAEALLRWNDPQLGAISPSEFVPIAEETGLIDAIGEWVLRTACGQARRWREKGYRPIRLAVNLSGHQLMQPRFAAAVAQILEETGVSASHLELEITESAIMQNNAVTAAALRALADLGVGLVLDDFGTGYSSLSHLRRLPISRVKIDRSFVSQISTNPDDAALTAGVIALAHTLQLRVTAEGVETLEQARFLRDVACDELQGFLLSPPIPPGAFVRFLEPEKPR